MRDRSAPRQGDDARAALLAAGRHVVLSPHYDDMALSIGGSMALAAGAGGEVVDLIVFGSEPAGIPLHAFAEAHHVAWGLSTPEVIAGRQAEERAAIAILGARTGNLPFHDAIYRGPWYASDAALFGVPDAAETDLPDAIAAATLRRDEGRANEESAPVRYYAPLGIGQHVDHQLALAAAQILARTGNEVWLYEDLPYSMIGDNLDRRTNALRQQGWPVAPVAAIAIDSTWDRKIDAVMAYPTQLETVFRNYAGIEPTRSGIDAGLSAFHRADDQSARVERFWTFTGV